MRELVIIGGNGQLGSDLVAVCRERGLRARSLMHEQIEIGDARNVHAALAGVAAPIVVNTAACHGPRGTTATTRQDYEAVNVRGVANLVDWCRQHRATLVHYSTDYVFGAEHTRRTPYREEDSPCPVNMYGVSKLEGEQVIGGPDGWPNHYIIRVASLYGRTGSRAKGNSNFVHGILHRASRGERVRVVTDQIMSPTWTRALAGKTLDLLAAESGFGLYHMAGSGACTWYEFARAIVDLAGLAVDVEPIPAPTEEPANAAARPGYTALDNARLRHAGVGDLPPWRESLAAYLSTLPPR